MHVIDICPRCGKDFMYHRSDTHLFRNNENEKLKKEYPVQDETWPSRRWNEERTVSVDLSGDYYAICQDCDEKENKHPLNQ